MRHHPPEAVFIVLVPAFTGHNCHWRCVYMISICLFSHFRWHCMQWKVAVLSYSEGSFKVYHHTEVTHCNLAWRTPPCQISAHQCRDWGTGPPKLKNLLKCYQISVSLARFSRICRACRWFHDVPAVKIWMELLTWRYEVMGCRGQVFSKFSVPHNGKTTPCPEKMEPIMF